MIETTRPPEERLEDNGAGRRRDGRRGVLAGALAMLLALVAAAPRATAQESALLDVGAISFGEGRLEVEIRGQVLEVHTYRPFGCAQPSVLFVFHGNGRTAVSYRNSARPLADRACFVVFSPLFDKDRWPNWAYHRGGVVDDGRLRPREDWSVQMVPALVDWARGIEGLSDRVFLFGHSAGAQFLSRVAAYAPLEDVARIILANPSTYVIADLDEAVPYGFGGFGDAADAGALMEVYLGRPVTVYLGTADTGSEELTMTEAAQRQGENRLDRGRQVFAQAREVAERNGWDFGWSMVEAEGVGHTARGMLGAPAMLEAMGLVTQ